MKISGWASGVLAAVAMCVTPYAAGAAGKFDGSAPLACALTDVHECAADAECKRVSAGRVNLPPFVKVDIRAGKVHSESAGRESPFKSAQRLDGTLLLQGSENERAWTMMIAETTGKMSATISAAEEGFVIFGSCMVLP